jgi:hypothetical protein
MFCTACGNRSWFCFLIKTTAKQHGNLFIKTPMAFLSVAGACHVLTETFG